MLSEGARLVAVGVAGGIAGALLVGRLLEALLFDVAATDPVSLGGGRRSAFAGVAALACVVPAWRAGTRRRVGGAPAGLGGSPTRPDPVTGNYTDTLDSIQSDDIVAAWPATASIPTTTCR